MFINILIALMAYWCNFLKVFPFELEVQNCSLPQVAAPIHAFSARRILAFSLTLTNIFVRFNPISWWSCTIAGRVCARNPSWAAGQEEGKGQAQKPDSRTSAGQGQFIWRARQTPTTTTNSSAKWCRELVLGFARILHSAFWPPVSPV